MLGLVLPSSLIIVSCLSGKGPEEMLAKTSTWRDTLTLVVGRSETETQLPEFSSSVFCNHTWGG